MPVPSTVPLIRSAQSNRPCRLPSDRRPQQVLVAVRRHTIHAVPPVRPRARPYDVCPANDKLVLVKHETGRWPRARPWCSLASLRLQCPGGPTPRTATCRDIDAHRRARAGYRYSEEQAPAIDRIVNWQEQSRGHCAAIHRSPAIAICDPMPSKGGYACARRTLEL